jgi:uncharacterized protein (DUF2062 family)
VSPEKLAVSIAVGTALALFPVIGTTTTLCVLAGLAFGLNQPVLQGINLLCYPVYFPLIAAFIWLGDRITGTRAAGLNPSLMVSLLSHHPSEFLVQFGSTLLHAVVGWAVVMPVWMPVAYAASLAPLRAAAAGLAGRRAARS